MNLQHRIALILSLASVMFIGCHHNDNGFRKGLLPSAWSTKKDSATAIWQVIDTNKVAILPLNGSGYKSHYRVIRDSLTIRDLEIVEELLIECVKDHNAKQDTSKKYSEYVDLGRYHRQYLIFKDLHGERMVYVHCICSDFVKDIRYDWKKSFIHIYDGGICVFDITINLTTQSYEGLYSNGYAWTSESGKLGVPDVVGVAGG